MTKPQQILAVMRDAGLSAADPRIAAGILWLLGRRQHDGGWAIPLRTRGWAIPLRTRAAPEKRSSAGDDAARAGSRPSGADCPLTSSPTSFCEHWPLGYAFALALMVLTSVGLYLLFRRRAWI
jgi:hypothetical protein